MAFLGFFPNYTLPDRHTEISSTLCAFIASIIFFKPSDNLVVGPKGNKIDKHILIYIITLYYISNIKISLHILKSSLVPRTTTTASLSATAFATCFALVTSPMTDSILLLRFSGTLASSLTKALTSRPGNK